jgi:hypothetical protein
MSRIGYLMRKIPLRYVGCAAVLAGAAACQSTTSQTIPDSTGKAIVRAYGGGAANWLAVTFKPIGEAHRVSIQSVNGEDATRYGNDRQLLLAPGHYEIAVQCIFIVDNRQHFSDGNVTVDVIAGRNYLVDAGLSVHGTQTCAARVSDTTTGPP